MLDQQIVDFVVKHYEKSTKPLLLSELGKELRVQGIWPTEGLEAGFRKTLESLHPKLKVIQDPKALAYLVVVPEGKEAIAEKAIRVRQNRQLLNSLPWALLPAFCKKLNEDEKVFFHTKRPFKYSISDNAQEEDFVLIDSKYRRPDIFIESIDRIPDDEVIALVEKIEKWMEDNGLSLVDFTSFDKKYSRPTGTLADTERVVKKGNALERLQAVQPTDIAHRIVIPLDIALALSRLP